MKHRKKPMRGYQDVREGSKIQALEVGVADAVAERRCFESEIKKIYSEIEVAEYDREASILRTH